MDYKTKYLKYKSKYLKLLEESNSLSLNKQKGGMTQAQFEQFKNELIQIYQIVSAKENICITGSSEVAYLLNRLGLREQLSQMELPGDVDLLYDGRENASSRIGNFIPVQATPQRSRTFNLLPEFSAGRIFTSFDLTNVPTLQYFILRDMNSNGSPIELKFLSLKTLRGLYQDDVEDAVEPELSRKRARLNAINLIIQTITDRHLLHEYGLDKNVTKRAHISSNLNPFIQIQDENSSLGSNLSFGFSNTTSPPPKKSAIRDSNYSNASSYLFGLNTSLFDSPPRQQTQSFSSNLNTINIQSRQPNQTNISLFDSPPRQQNQSTNRSLFETP